MSQPYVGEIRTVGFNFAPSGWAFCDGALLSISDNPTLFTLIGTTYGGDGVNTFGLPDLRGRVPIHMGTSSKSGNPYVIGQNAGNETVTLVTNQLPQHTHPLAASNSPASLGLPAGNSLAVTTGNGYVPSTAPVVSTSISTNTGGSLSHDNMMPFQCINFVISLFGVYPSQG